MVILVGAIHIFFICLSLCDGFAALRGWRGLRILRAPAWISLTLGGVMTLLFVRHVISAENPGLVLAGSLVALPIFLVLLLLNTRKITPEEWIMAGVWERHRVTAIDIPLEGGHVPALVFEPLTDSVGAVVLIHGAGAHKTFYSWPLVDGLLDARLTVCAIDLDGHGDNPRVLDFPSVLDNVGVAVAWLRERYAWVGVVGVSLGGCVAARAVADGVEVDALALLEAPADVQITRRSIRHERLTILRRATWGLHRYAGSLHLVRAWRTAPTRSRIGTIDLIRRLDLLGSVARIRCPLWLGYGGNDLVVPVAQAREIGRTAPPNTPLLIIPRATHLSVPIDQRVIRPLSVWLGESRRTTGDSGFGIQDSVEPTDSAAV